MVRKLGTWLLGLAACAQTSCYQHHTADEELLGLPGAGPGVSVADAGGAAPSADAGASGGDAGAGCPGTDAISQLACTFLSDAGAGAGNINDLINSLGGLGALAGVFGGTGGAAAPGRDAGSTPGAVPGGAQCQNATDALTQFFCSLQGGGGAAFPFGRRDGGAAPMMQNPPPAEPADAGAPVVEDAGVPATDAEVDAVAVP